ncbi:probable calcium-binding protein CML10 [Andrographis paniculata]|uniref:probable calcium-binding protein CML10 n=1 Tax=Andrographis paniculata TaxID=175694 RepID=UPI0021E98AF7|nr:probable calcium-binding protein CML10 [Andrographis paniculata]
MSRKSKAAVPLTVEEEVKRIFDMFDGDGDGRISMSELGAVLNNLGSRTSDEMLSRIMPELDTDGDGFIDFEEFKAFHLGGASGSGGGDRMLKAAFDMYDKDGNGKISDVELQSVLRSLGQKCTLQDCRKMIASYDIDGDGFVDFEEFKVMMGS